MTNHVKKSLKEVRRCLKATNSDTAQVDQAFNDMDTPEWTLAMRADVWQEVLDAAKEAEVKLTKMARKEVAALKEMVDEW